MSRKPSHMRVLMLIFTLILGVVILPTQFNAQSAEPIRLYILAWSPDGSQIAGASSDGLHIWDASTKNQQIIVTVAEGVYSLAWSPNSDKLALGRYDGKVSVYNISTGQLLTSSEAYISDPVAGIVWNSDGTKVISTGYIEGGIGIWDASTLQGIAGSPGGGFDLEISHDGSTIAESYTGGITFYDSSTGEALAGINHENTITSLDWSPDDSMIVGGSGTAAYVWNVATNQVSFTLAGHSEYVQTVAWNPNGDQIASADSDGNIRIWDTNTGQLLSAIQAGSSILDWSPDGTQIVYGGEGISIEIIDVSNISVHETGVTGRDVGRAQDGLIQEARVRSYPLLSRQWREGASVCAWPS